jgi:hypothetical protein
MAVDLDDVSRCPLAKRCESCGERGDLELVTIGTPVGVYCFTVCAACVVAARFPKDWVRTAELVCRHCEHLGVDLDEMAAAADAETRS